MQVTLNTLDSDKFRCEKCPTTERIKKSCAEYKESSIHRVGDIMFKTCPGNFSDRSLFGYLSMHKQWENGNLPYPGSVSEQPAKIMDVFRIIDSFKSDKKDEAIKKANLKARRGR